MKNKHLEFVRKHKIHHNLLRDFISRGLWSVALQTCETAIARSKEETQRLEELHAALTEEVGR